ncbi:hypothetical protein [Taibaiella soli]|uniref:Uncharacterized protein n=1 Tax=Taibaiella soli TaxID=1649169 RepID=A0A2W2AM32_9BACT|nr:hypothetical protein [Taibaiella soli]PZF74592.1 hypothetical protein DN068_03170 [Taibaiella soli]
MTEIPELIPKMNDDGAHFRRLPLPLKILVTGAIVGCVIWAAVIQPFKEHRNIKNFYDQKITSLVVSFSDDGRFTSWKLKNGLYVDFFCAAKNQLTLGDSIVKEPQTFLYKVYRKDIAGEYQFFADFDFMVLK